MDGTVSACYRLYCFFYPRLQLLSLVYITGASDCNISLLPFPVRPVDLNEETDDNVPAYHVEWFRKMGFSHVGTVLFLLHLCSKWSGGKWRFAVPGSLSPGSMSFGVIATDVVDPTHYEVFPFHFTHVTTMSWSDRLKVGHLGTHILAELCTPLSK